MISKQNAMAWLVILIVMCSISVYQINNHWRIQTDIFALLPQGEQAPTVETTRQMVSGELGRIVLFLIGHAQPQMARNATQQLGEMIEHSRLFTTVQWDYSQQPQAFFEFYFPFRYQFISPIFRSYLAQEDGYQYLINHLKRELYQPTSLFSTRLLADDPFLFFPELMKSFGTNIAQLNSSQVMNRVSVDKHGPLDGANATVDDERTITIEDGMVGTTYKGRHYYFIIAQLASNPFEEEAQNQLEESWQRWSKQLRHSHPNLELTYTAVARFASSMRHHMQKDMFFVSAGSTIGIILLIGLIFRSVKHILIAFIPVAFGFWGALGVSLLIFGELHAFTLVFGSSLIGVCVDYSMHYFAYHRVSREWNSFRVMMNIFPAIGLGALTTILSYIALGLTPLVGLQQTALFASCGIIISFFTVVFWYPFFLSSSHSSASHIPRAYYTLQRLLFLWKDRRLTFCISFIVLMLLSTVGLLNLRVDDSPLIFKTFPEELVEQDRFTRIIMGIPETQQYLIVNGETSEATLQRLEDFQDYMHKDTIQDNEIFGPMITTFLPSQKRQEENLRSIRKLLNHEQEISYELLALGFSESNIHKFFSNLRKEPEGFLTPSKWLNHRVSIGLRNFWFSYDADRTSIVVRLQSVTDVLGINDVLSSFEGIRYFDYMEDFTRILRRYRENVMLLVIGAYCVIFVLLFWRYQQRGFFVILPSFAGAYITVGSLGLLGETLNLLHCLSLVLILGMGVDYAIFLAESDPSHRPTTFLASTLATATTVLSFGLLSFSSQEALRAIGLTTFLGIMWVWLLSPLAMYGHSQP